MAGLIVMIALGKNLFFRKYENKKHLCFFIFFFAEGKDLSKK